MLVHLPLYRALPNSGEKPYERQRYSFIWVPSSDNPKTRPHATPTAAVTSLAPSRA